MDWKDESRGVFLINLLGVIYDRKAKKVLIGRREKDPFIKELTWAFPGGRPGYEDDLEKYLKEQIRIKTGLEIEIERILFAKTYPEKRQFLSIYYLCRAIGGKENAGERFKELKWAYPKELKNYFTTSLHPKLLEMIGELD